MIAGAGGAASHCQGRRGGRGDIGAPEQLLLALLSLVTLPTRIRRFQKDRTCGHVIIYSLLSDPPGARATASSALIAHSPYRLYHSNVLLSRQWFVCEAWCSPHPSALFRPCLQPSERALARSVPSKPPPGAAEGGFDGTKQAGTRGRKQGRNSADGCGEDLRCVCNCMYVHTYLARRQSVPAVSPYCPE